MRRLLKRLLWAGALLLLSPVLAEANQNAQGWCESGAKVVVTSGLSSTTQVQASYPQCTITVNIHAGGLAPNIYSDNFNTPLGNPFTSALNGQWLFYAPNGRYDIIMSGGGLTSPITYSDVILFDCLSGNCGGGGNNLVGSQYSVAEYAGTGLSNQLGPTNCSVDPTLKNFTCPGSGSFGVGLIPLFKNSTVGAGAGCTPSVAGQWGLYPGDVVPWWTANGGPCVTVLTTGNINSKFQYASAAGCTTGSSIGNTCASPISITWAVSFANSTYLPICTGNGIGSGVPGAPYIASQSNSSITVNYPAITAAAASYTTVSCWAVEN